MTRTYSTRADYLTALWRNAWAWDGTLLSLSALDRQRWAFLPLNNGRA